MQRAPCALRGSGPSADRGIPVLTHTWCPHMWICLHMHRPSTSEIQKNKKYILFEKIKENLNMARELGEF